MYEPWRRRVLSALKVPPEPHPPLGNPASLRVFHAGRNYFRLRLAAWGVAQVLALAGILFWTAVLIDVEHQTRDRHRSLPAPTIAPEETAASSAPAPEAKKVESRRKESWQNRLERRLKASFAASEAERRKGGLNNIVTGFRGFKDALVEIALNLPPWAFTMIWAVKLLSFAIYLLQIPLTYAVRRLDYEMRWYMVTDRSLRLRHGVWKISESTMSFANIQQVSVSQGPLQRALGLADVKVKSAGGGSGPGPKHEIDDMHSGIFHSVTNASEIRDLILERLRTFRAAGLGDPDDATQAPAASTPVFPIASVNPTLGAAQELLQEAKALRAALS